MPNIITHCLSAKEACQHFDNIHWRYLYFGAQGPDFFYYYHQLSWKKETKQDKAFQSLGDVFHHQHVNEWLLYFCQKEDIQLKSYGLGLLCHFALDTYLHPFIFYFTEQHPKNQAGYIHRCFESHLERVMIDEYDSAITPKQYFLLSKKEQRQLACEYHQLLARWGEEGEVKQILESMTECQLIHSLLNNPWSIQEKCLSFIEKHTDQCIQAHSLIIPQKAEALKVFLSKEKVTWCHPVTGERQSASFSELFMKAQQEAKELVALAMENQWDVLTEKINHRNLDTGLPFESPMRTFFHSS